MSRQKMTDLIKKVSLKDDIVVDLYTSYLRFSVFYYLIDQN